MYASTIKPFFSMLLKAAVLLLTAFVLVACGGSQTPVATVAPAPMDPEQPDKTASLSETPEPLPLTPEGERPLVVVLLLPLSGPEEDTGKAMLRAATMALFDAYDPKIRLIPLDTEADIEVAETRAREAVQLKASVVLGPLLASNVKAAGDILAPAGTPVIGFSNDSRVADAGRFIMGFLPEVEVKRVLDHASGQGLTNMGALIPMGRYGDRIRLAFGDAAQEAGISVEAIESYPPDPDALFEPVKRLARYDERRADVRQEARFLRSLRDDVTDEIAEKLEDAEVMEGVSFDAVLVPEGGAMMRTLAPLLPFYEIDPNRVKLLGTGLWNDEALLGEPPLQGAWFAAPDPVEPTAFLKRFEQTYGSTAPRIATLAYDAMALVATLAREPLDETVTSAENTAIFNDSRITPARLMSPEGFSGIDGLFRFLPDGTAERALAVLEIKRGGFEVVDPAPTSFPSFGYALKKN